MSDKTATMITAEFNAWAQQQYTVGSCMFCPDFPGVTGPTEHVRAALAEHRAEAHPDLRRRRRGRTPGIIVFNGAMTSEEREAVQIARTKRMRLLGIEEDGGDPDGVPSDL